MLMLLFPALIACSERRKEEPLECDDIERSEIVDETTLEVVDSNHQFAFNIYAELSESDNVFLSPYSISTALGMLHLGAEQNTEHEMSDMLGVFAEGAEDWHLGQGTLLQEFELNDNCDYQLSVANRAYFQTGYNFNEQFADDLSRLYQSEVGELDFASDPNASRIEINEWVSEKTNEHIPELFPEGTINSATRLVLTNAIYLNGPWDSEFDPDSTFTTDFYLADGTSTDVEMMSQSDMAFSVAHHDTFQIVEIPYKGEELVFTAIVPFDATGLEAIEAELDAEKISSWKEDMYQTEGHVSMPKFEMRYKELLNETLEKMGMQDAFTGAADFTGISEEGGLSVDVVIHEAWLKVSEEGTEAAAATGISVGETSAGEFVQMNKPFIFLIEDKLSGSILFMGKLADPSQL